ncbi:hypothetical protein M8C13_10735 [Crossiella sp. SN42]|uniref:hypothetical protein n=1 Tax=Crossiella sp. SN42 TaxID=2944808 RepID=UPI00207C9D82|nr:hypothetical protein [Crossiella sp. SN42]MCO1576230.1 hypothetical protein [Crossiella sp. SN42]
MTSTFIGHDLAALRPVPHVGDWAPTGCPGLPDRPPQPGVLGEHDGVHYTVAPTAPRWLRAHDPATHTPDPGRDIPLGPAPLPLTGVRGGLFTPNSRVLLIADDPNTVFCFDLLRVPGEPRLIGVCTGARPLPELPGRTTALVLRSWWQDGKFTPLHVLTAHGGAHGLAVPEPIEL